MHLLNDDGSRITRVIAPGFDEGFARSQEVAVSPTTGASAAAAYLRRQIVQHHIGEDERDEAVKGASSDPHGKFVLKARKHGGLSLSSSASSRRPDEY